MNTDLIRFAAGFCMAAGMASAAISSRPAEFADTALLKAGDDGYFIYWNPAAVVTKNGTVVVLLEGRKGSDSDFASTDLLALRSADGGRTWGKFQVVAAEGAVKDQITMGNACPVYDSDTGRIWCIFNRNNQEVLVTYSDDDGAKWSVPEDITIHVRPIHWTRYWTGPGHGLQLQRGAKRGRMIFPSVHMAYEVSHDGRNTAFVARSHVIYSDDHGKSWKIGGDTKLDPEVDPRPLRFTAAWLPGEATWHGDECMAAELDDGSLYMVIRSSGAFPYPHRKKEYTWSRDGGETWSTVKEQPQIPDPSCQSSLARWDDPAGGKPTFAYVGITLDPSLHAAPWTSATNTEEGAGTRQRLALFLSDDGCRNWREAAVLHQAAAAYSDLVTLADGTMLCFYDGGEREASESIRVARFNREWVAQHPSTPPPIPPLVARDDTPLKSEILFKAGEGGYLEQWNPATVVTRNGTVVLLVEGRKGSTSDFASIDLLSMRSTDNGHTWSKWQVVWTEGTVADQITIGNACPVYDADTGRIWCVFNRKNQDVLVTFSDDDGVTWSKPRDITRQVRPLNYMRYWVGPGHGLQLKKGPKPGRMIFPSVHLEYESAPDGESASIVARSNMIYTDDHGATWNRGGNTALAPNIDQRLMRFNDPWVPGEATWHGDECMATELNDGRLYLIIRSSGAAHFDRREEFAWSTDAGETWSPVKTQPQVVNANCQTAITKWVDPLKPNSEAFLFTGITIDPNRCVPDDPKRIPEIKGRQRLVAYVSTDACENWRETAVIFPRAAAYCDLVPLADGTVLCFYDGGELHAYESIRMTRLSADWMRRQMNPPGIN